MTALDTAARTVSEIEATSYWATCKTRPTTHLYKAHAAALQTVAELTPEPIASPWPRYGVSIGFRISQRTPSEQDAEIAEIVSLGAQAARIDRPSSALVDKLLGAGVEPVYIFRGDTPPILVQTPAEFGKECAAIAASLVGRVRFFEVMNEPDLNGYAPERYGPYLREAYLAVKAANPAAVVLHGGLWKWHDSPGYGIVDWVASLCALGFHKYTDALNVHAYDDPTMHGTWSLWDMVYGSGGAGFYDSRNVRSVLASYGASGLPIVVTEAGGPTPKYPVAMQAAVVRHALDAADGIGLAYRKAAFTLIYCVRDDDGADAGGFGLIDPAGVKRPAFDAYQLAVGS